MTELHNVITDNLITDNIDVWTSAIKKKSATGRGSSKKIELTGINKLRELILELAVRGKLVSQDTNDEPAGLLLEKIGEIKQELIKSKVLKKTRKQPDISEEEKSHALPNGWEWARLEDVYDVRDGTHDSPKAQPSGYPLVTSKNLSSGRLDLSDIKYISEADHLKVIARSKVDRDDILFAMIGSIGNPVIVDIEPDFSIKNVGLFKYFDKELSVPLFLKHYLVYASVIMKKQSGGGVQPFVSLGKLRSFVISLPPLAEQQRIVAKVDELMALCDQLEQQTEQSLTAHQTLVEELLKALTDSKDADDFQASWQRIAEHFDILFTTEQGIEQLKQTILQLAVMGKLVPQNPSDEPASVLLEKIAEEKAQLIKDKKIKKQKKMIDIPELDLPYQSPTNWRWCRLGDLCQTVADGPHFSPKYVEESEGVTFLSTRNISVNSIDLSTAKYVSKDDHESFCKRVRVKKGDILYTKGGTTGIAKVNDLDIEFSVWVHLAVLQIPNDKLDNEFLALSLNSPHCYKQSQTYTNGIGNKDLGLTRMINITISLPPLAEQHRIVAKVDELMALCEQLKARLNEAQTTQLHLADAVVENALN